MADLRRRTRKSCFEKVVWFSKLGFSVIGVVSFGVAARISVPPAAAAAPRLWASLCSWLAPPYLFVVVHLIVVVIWKLSDHKQQLRDPSADAADSAEIKYFETPPALPIPQKPSPDIWREILPSPTAAIETSRGSGVAPEGVPSPTASTLPAADFCENPAAPTEGIGVALEEQPGVPEAAEDEVVDRESMEQTWMAIMKNSSRAREAEPAALEELLVETAVVRRREPSVTCRDELNRRFDEFIKRKYDQLRLQRHESNQRRSEMLNAG